MVNKKTETTIQEKERRLKRKEQELDFTTTFVATIVGALTLVAGLFWQNDINSLLNVLPVARGITGKFISALVLTIIFVIITLKLNSQVKVASRKLVAISA